MSSRIVVPLSPKDTEVQKRSTVMGCIQSSSGTAVLFLNPLANEMIWMHYEQFCKNFALTLEERVALRNYFDRMKS